MPPDHAATDDVLQGALPVRRWAERRAVVLTSAAILFLGVFALRQSSADPAPALALLYVVPIALVAIELGLLAGLMTATAALALVGVWALGADPEVSFMGMFTRGVAFFAVGSIAGRFSDQMRESQRRQQLLLESGLALSKLTEANELSSRLVEDARRLVGQAAVHVDLDSSMSQSNGHHNGNVVIPIATRGVRYGTLAVAPGRAVDRQDRATLAILALQAAVAAENRRLLEVERERAIIGAELHEARASLAERGRELREVMDRQEAERDHVSLQLREQAAQTLAAMLLGLRALERDLDSERAAPTLGALQSDADATLRSLRALAASLRPPTLQLGLPAALDALAEQAGDRGWGEMTVAVQDVGDLDPDMETMAYRLVEEAAEAGRGAASVIVRTDPAAHELVIVMDVPTDAIAPERLTLLRARLGIVRGTLTADGGELRITIPLPDHP